MIWPGMLFNLCVALLFTAYLLRGVRRYERRADAIMAKLDCEHQAQLQKYDALRDEIRASMRSQVDEAIAEMMADAARAEAEAERTLAEIAEYRNYLNESQARTDGHVAGPSLSESMP
jgi:hypothetical protein